jgi:PAS domain S-box-containing protein
MSISSSVQPITIDHHELIRSLSVPFLAYEATEPYRILDENEAHELVAMTKREDIIGRPFLEVYPDTSEEYRRTGKSAPIESIKKIVRTKKPDSLGDFKWDVADANGTLVTKYWRSTQYPIFNESGTKVVAVYQLTTDITHEMHTEHTLEQTQKKLLEVLATGQVGTWSFDMKSGIAKGGPNLSRMFGLDPEEAGKGIPLEQFVEKIHPDDRERVSREIDAAVISGELYESEYRIVHTDDTVRWVLARGQTKNEDLDGTNIFSGTLVDITERKQNEAILQQSEERLRFMADSMPQLVWITQPDGYHEYYNHQWYEYTGTKEGDTDGEGWNKLFYPGDQARAWKVWKHSLETGEPYEIEYRLYHAPTDSYRWVIGRALPLKDENGTILKWYGTCTDIDEQKRAADVQSVLADVSKEIATTPDTRKMLRNVSKLCVPIISDWCSVDIYSDSEGFEQIAVAHADPKKVRLAKEYRAHNPLRIDDDTAIPKMVRGEDDPVFYPSITDEMLEAYIKDKKTLKFMKSLELRSIMIVPLKMKDKVIGGISFVSAGSGRHFNDIDFEMANDIGNRASLALTNAKLFDDAKLDLTHRKELEKELRIEKQRLEARVKERTQQLQLTNEGLRDEIVRRRAVEQELHTFSNELARSNEELENFAYVASHDLQEPLRKIQAFGNLLLGEHGDSLGEEGADYLQRMHGAANRMSTLIEDLLTFSRVTRKESPKRNVDLNVILEDVRSDLETRIEETGARITIGKLPTISADPTHMRQLFQNLIGNAIKFHKPNESPFVKVTSKQKNDGIEIRVADNGVGFDEKYKDRIFSVFQRLHERTKYEGTGIGLAVCRKIAQRYGGTITATSKKGEGSTFIVWLPISKGKK